MSTIQEIKGQPFLVFAACCGCEVYSVRASQMIPRSVSQEIEIPVAELSEWLLETGRKHHFEKVGDRETLVMGNVSAVQVAELGFSLSAFIARSSCVPRASELGTTGEPNPKAVTTAILPSGGQKAGPRRAPRMESYKVQFIPEVFENGVVQLHLHYAGEPQPELRKLWFYSRQRLETVFASAGLPSLKVCTVESSGQWSLTARQLAMISSGADEIRL